jgi:hypothetical protein
MKQGRQAWRVMEWDKMLVSGFMRLAQTATNNGTKLLY